MISSESVDEEGFIEEEKLYLVKRWTVISCNSLWKSVSCRQCNEIASIFGVSSLVIGSTIIAIGTSLPEVAGTISAAKMRKPILFLEIFLDQTYSILG